MKTTAAILEKINEPLLIEELEIPPLKPGQVLVEVHFSGICQTQMNEIRGLKGEDKFLPHTLGHEGSGIVLEIGQNVTRVKPGDSVVMTWIKGNGLEVSSTQYQRKKGIVNSGAISTFLTHAVVSENRLVPIQDFPMDLAALFGCAIPTGMGMIFNHLKPSSESSIAIWGVGGIGLSAVMAAKAVGCHPIIAVDIHDSKLEMAKSVGATHLVNGKENPLLQILEITQGKGVDYGVEAAGTIQTMEMGYSAVRKNGGRFVIAGNVPHGQKISIDPFDLICGKQISGTWGGESNLEKDIVIYLKSYQERKLPLENLITDQLRLEDINKAILQAESGMKGRFIIAMKKF